MSPATTPVPPPEPLGSTAAYADPRATCDVVMRGGVTSGVVYPWAVCEIAREHRLVQVGGTSAGAVAAAVSAAAELGRDGGATGRGGFAVLARLPGDLATPTARRGRRPSGSRLSDLFVPTRATMPLLDLVLAVLAARDGGSWPRAVLTGVAAAGRAPGGWWRVAVGAVPGVLLLAAAVSAFPALGWVVAGLLGLLLTVVGVVLGAAWVHLRAAQVAVPDNLFGVCTGMPADGTADDGTALTPWVTDLLDEAAGLPDGAGPLTFGHLWAGPGATPLTGLDEAPAGAAVRLQVVTTSLTHGRPVRLPLDPRRPGVPPVYADPAELRRLLPERVVAWVEAHPPPLPADPAERLARRVRDAQLRPLVPLPAASDWPVVLAVRASLSFPLLLSAVPFRTVDVLASADAARRVAAVVGEVLAGDVLPSPGPAADGRSGPDDAALAAVLARVAGAAPTTRRVWTSDGGVTSNFPIHFFDTAAPVRPTFGVTLRPARQGGAPADPLDPGGPGPLDDALPPVRYPLAGTSTWHFGRAVLGALQDGSDVAQLPLPGFRDRIAQVDVDPGDGGWDVRMPPAAIARLASRGRAAGVALRERFAEADAEGWTGWERHRWTRLRANLPLLEQAAGEVTAALRPGTARPGERDLRDLLRLPTGEQPGYAWVSDDQRRRALAAVGALLEAAPGETPPAEQLDAGAPQPPLALRYVARDST
ncbi:patatin-like phospholipase family protein [Pseudokineococcus lusitanus]|uniref:Patatin-like phospholipase n=1 Tax=Pseudokineococcus lusitanus TaxID=763993 RepID=A0A3N1HR53_9ACTN|nr:patatin-like phospholipase family protein [Pseudokineococcus lusitanus]ROP44994.1 patatin-like phospholipase [Pseudokineococcus lusitanus]